MSTVGQKERLTQKRIVKLFRQQLGYAYLGNWEERPDTVTSRKSICVHFSSGKDMMRRSSAKHYTNSIRSPGIRPGASMISTGPCMTCCVTA